MMANHGPVDAPGAAAPSAILLVDDDAAKRPVVRQLAAPSAELWKLAQAW